jgi:hypothetical protein
VTGTPAEETRLPVEEPEEEELVGVKGLVREEMWAIVSVAMQQQGERSDEMFGMMIEPSETDDGESLTSGSEEERDDSGEEMAVEEKDAQLEQAYAKDKREGFQGQCPENMGMKEMDELEA